MSLQKLTQSQLLAFASHYVANSTIEDFNILLSENFDLISGMEIDIELRISELELENRKLKAWNNAAIPFLESYALGECKKAMEAVRE